MRPNLREGENLGESKSRGLGLPALKGLFGLGLLFIGLWGCDKRKLPAEYQNLAVPHQVLASAEAREAGQELFFLHCSNCHGENADGKGAIHRQLSSRPVDFTDPEWNMEVSPTWVFFVIREGRKHSAMAGWDGKLTAESCWNLTAFVLSVVDTSNRTDRS